MSLARTQDDLDGLKYSNHLYDREDEIRKSTGSIYGDTPGKVGLPRMHVRSNSDTSEINVAVKNSLLPENLIAEARSPTGESFFALVRKFERIQNDPKAVTSEVHHSATYPDGLRAKASGNPGAASPSIERKTPVLLRRKNSLKGNSSFLNRMLKSSSDSKGAAEEDSTENTFPRKAFAHYDCQSISLDFDELAKLRIHHGDGLKRKNTRSGASAASSKRAAAAAVSKLQCNGSDSSASSVEEAVDLGDNKSNELVQCCPFFRNELGGEEDLDPQIGLSRDNTAFQNPHDPSRPKEPKLDKTLKRRSTLDILLTAYDSARHGNLSSGTGVTILDNSRPEGGPLFLGERAPISEEEAGKVVFEHVDHGSYFYRNFFYGQEHQNYLGLDDKFGAVAVSLRREKLDETCAMMKGVSDGQPHFQYRAIVRSSELTALRGTILEDAIPSTSRHGTTRALPAKDILEHVCPELQLTALRLTVQGPKVPEQLLKLDEQGMTHQYKVGILYCKAGQCTEEEMYNNQVAGPPFEEFLELIGERVNLKGFEGYRAQLDNRSDSTGEQSVYTRFHGREIMFHVSTLLPWTPNNRQQLLRKRHIGNDIVTIVFQEPGAEPFTPKNIRSHFQHVFIVVRVYNPCSDNTYYRVAVSRSRDVPPFGPPIPAGAKFGKQEAFASFLLTKVINAENAAHKSEKFSAMAARTRHEYLKDLATNNVSSVPLDSGGKAFGKFLSNKKKEKVQAPICPEKVSRGSLVWHVQVEDYRNSTMIECSMGVSADTLVLVDSSSKQALFSIPTKAIIGWTSLSESIKVFYGSGDCLVLSIPTSLTDVIPEIVRRLDAVSSGCQTQTMTLRRNHQGQLGFHVQYEGLIKDVEFNGMAWSAGLRHGCRLVEINGLIVATLTHEQMIEILRRPGSVMAVIVPPLPNGKPRKGVQQSGQPWWSNRSSTATISSCYSSTSSVTDDQESREHSHVDATTRKVPPKVAPKKFARGKDGPWIMRQLDGVEPKDARRSARDGSPHSTPSGSTSSLNDDPRYQSPSYGASYTVTSVGTNDVNGHARLPGNQQETQVVSTYTQSHPDKRKWSGYVKIDSDPKVQNTVGVTLAPTASGTFIALASTSTPPSTPKTETPILPDTPIFGSFSQRPDGKQHRRMVVSDPTMDGGGERRKNGSTREPAVDGEAPKPGEGLPRADGQSTVPFKETSLGAVILTTETYKEKHKGSPDDLSEAVMSETVDQIERAFGFKAPEMIDSPRKVIAPNMGSLERGGSLGRRKKMDNSNGAPQEAERNGREPGDNPQTSLQELQISDSVRPKFGETAMPTLVPSQAQNSFSQNEAIGADSILMRLTNEMNLKGRTPTTTQGETNGVSNITTVVDASREKAEVKKEIRRKPEYEARVAARNLIIERLESHRQSLEGDGVEGLKIYHAKSRSTPADVSKNRRSLPAERSSKTRHTSSQDDIHSNARPSLNNNARKDDVRKSEPSPRRRKSSEIPVASKDSRAKPVVRSERKINLSTPTSPRFEKSMSLPQHKIKRRHRQPAKQAAHSESDDETPKFSPRHRKSDTTEPKLRTNAFKRTASLPREHGASAIPRPINDSRAHRSHTPQLKGARITKLRVSPNEEAAPPSLVDQTSRLLSASQDIKYDKGAFLVIAADVLHSLTQASDLLHAEASREEKEDKERERKDRSLAKSKSLGRARSHGPHKFYIPVVPRRHSFDERIFASSSAKGNSKESSLTRESIGKEAELEMKLAIVSNALMKEGEERQRIENDLKRSQKENKRLQEDLRTASGQLRKFTEWFFQSVELNTT